MSKQPLIKTYYNPDDRCWWAYQVDREGNQVGDAEPAPTEELARRYLKMFSSQQQCVEETLEAESQDT